MKLALGFLALAAGASLLLGTQSTQPNNTRIDPGPLVGNTQTIRVWVTNVVVPGTLVIQGDLVIKGKLFTPSITNK